MKLSLNATLFQRLTTLLLLAAVAGAFGCKPGEKPNPASPTEVDATRVTNYYYTAGTVKLVRLENQRLMIEHEEIPGYMPKMTMPFEVQDAALLKGIEVNDRLEFRIVDTPNEAWIDSIRKVGVATPTERPTNRMFRVVREVDVLEVGDSVPSYAFTNELGNAVQLADLKGQAYALTFIFTRCQFPNFCPRMSGNFSKAIELLKSDSSAPTNWKFFSLSFDVQYDTPQVLAGYAKHYRYDPVRWSFLTGALIDVDAITEQFGLVFPRSETFGFDHNMRTVVVDARGRVHTILIGNEWTAEELAEQVKQAAVAK